MNLVGKILKNKILRHLLALVIGVAALFPLTTVTTLTAASGERTLYLFYTHTNETKRITFRRNGRYDQAGLRELNQFLRDWRRNEPTTMDPPLFDLLWQVYQEVGATKPIYVVSAYRSPQTNEMLRSRSGAVAKNSRHTMGMAMDFYIPGIAISKLRETAMRYQVGGVGYYPTSGNPFVHLDTGNVRAWPRMTRNQLARLFPDGKTLHLASDGSVLSAAGRRYATAEWEKCHSVPCNGSNSITAPSRNSRGNSNSGSTSGSGGTLMDLFFGNNQNDNTTSTVVAANAPTRRSVTAVAIVAPTPAARAPFLAARDPVTPPTPATMSAPMLIATRSQSDNLDLNPNPVAVALVDTQSTRPTPRVLLSQERVASSQLLAAYAPISQPESDAQQALQMLIERRNEASTPTIPDLRGSIVTASLGPVPTDAPTPVELPLPSSLIPASQNSYASLFANTFDAVEQAQPAATSETNIALAFIDPPAQRNNLPITMREIQFFAPEFEHMTGSLTMHAFVAGDRYAVLYEPDESHFNPTTELGPQSGQIVFSLSETQPMASDRFTRVAPIILTDI